MVERLQARHAKVLKPLLEYHSRFTQAPPLNLEVLSRLLMLQELTPRRNYFDLALLQRYVNPIEDTLVALSALFNYDDNAYRTFLIDDGIFKECWKNDPHYLTMMLIYVAKLSDDRDHKKGRKDLNVIFGKFYRPDVALKEVAKVEELFDTIYEHEAWVVYFNLWMEFAVQLMDVDDDDRKVRPEVRELVVRLARRIKVFPNIIGNRTNFVGYYPERYGKLSLGYYDREYTQQKVGRVSLVPASGLRNYDDVYLTPMYPDQNGVGRNRSQKDGAAPRKLEKLLQDSPYFLNHKFYVFDQIVAQQRGRDIGQQRGRDGGYLTAYVLEFLDGKRSINFEDDIDLNDTFYSSFGRLQGHPELRPLMNSPEMIERLLEMIRQCNSDRMRNEIAIMLVLIIEDTEVDLSLDDYQLLRRILATTSILNPYFKLHPTAGAYPIPE